MHELATTKKFASSLILKISDFLPLVSTENLSIYSIGSNAHHAILNKSNILSLNRQFSVNNNYSMSYPSTSTNIIIYSQSYAWSFLFLFVFTIIGFIGNTLVCLAIKIDPTLQNTANHYLFSLALADLLVSVMVIPFAILKGLNSNF